jgi:hypothetical protein
MQDSSPALLGLEYRNAVLELKYHKAILLLGLDSRLPAVLGLDLYLATAILVIEINTYYNSGYNEIQNSSAYFIINYS